MIVVGVLSWWYSGGILQRVEKSKERLLATLDFFSIGLLLSTLFSPFRQISAGATGDTIGEKLQAFADKTISRIIGAIVRSLVALLGMLAILAQCIASIVLFILWLAMPLLPVIGLLLFAVGWVPWA